MENIFYNANTMVPSNQIFGVDSKRVNNSFPAESSQQCTNSNDATMDYCALPASCYNSGYHFKLKNDSGNINFLESIRMDNHHRNRSLDEAQNNSSEDTDQFQTFTDHRSVINQHPVTIAHQGAVKGSPITINWLRQNYEAHPDFSLPRSLLYSHYKSHCYSVGIFAMNSASFGKLIRMVFPNLKTRRLGTRGNSKYHYDGIRVKPNSYLMSNNDDFIKMNMYTAGDENYLNGNGIISDKEHLNSQLERDNLTKTEGFRMESNDSCDKNDERCLMTILTAEIIKECEEVTMNKKYFDHLKLEVDIPLLKSYICTDGQTSYQLPDAILSYLSTIFREYFREMLENMKRLRYASACKSAYQFWSSIDRILLDGEVMGRYPELTIDSILSHSTVLRYLDDVEAFVYQCIIDAFQNEVLNEVNDSYLLTVRRFSFLFEVYCKWAMHKRNLPDCLMKIKLKNMDVFTHILRRNSHITSLYRGAKTAFESMAEMSVTLADITDILDFRYIFQLHSLSHRAEHNHWQYISLLKTVKRFFEEDTKKNIEEPLMKIFCQILNISEPELNVVNAFEAQFKTSAAFIEKCFDVVQRFNHLNFLILKQMTLTSCDNYGAYHLYLMFSDSYISFIMEKYIERFTHLSPTQQLSQYFQTSNFQNENELEIRQDILYSIIEDIQNGTAK